ncbi:effector-associated constant component EACC1 [Nocardia sp. KC 131]|uniref:effector-associated constant component EACC1 n=1 Tax=Nocardia arseniciresistens TaxID=3392119 RepID=UPI00398F1B23
MPEAKGQLTIHTHGNADDLFQLLEWFNDDDELRGRVSLPPNKIRPGQMGDLSDVLVVAVGAGGIAPALARCLTAWFTVRRSDIAITLKIDDHTEITLDAKRIKTPEITQALQSMLERPHDPQ